jgi:hypothetical protein
MSQQILQAEACELRLARMLHTISGCEHYHRHMDVNDFVLVFFGAEQALGLGADVDNPIILTQEKVDALHEPCTRASTNLNHQVAPLVVCCQDTTHLKGDGALIVWTIKYWCHEEVTNNQINLHSSALVGNSLAARCIALLNAF